MLVEIAGTVKTPQVIGNTRRIVEGLTVRISPVCPIKRTGTARSGEKSSRRGAYG
jgi:hypothetical protein